MTDEQTEHLHRYFSEEPAWRRQLGQLKKKYLAGYTAGVVSLRDATKAECDAAERLLGRHFTPPQLRYSLSEFEQSLCNSCFAIPTLGDFWMRLEGRPLVPNKQRKEQRFREIADFYAREALYAHGFVAHSWLNALQTQHTFGYRLLLPLIGKDRAAENWLHWVCCGLDRLEQNDTPEMLAVFSSAVTTDPHAFDMQNTMGQLLIQALAFWKQRSVPENARQRLELLRASGLYTDDISGYTVQIGLILLDKQGEEHPGFASFRRRQEMCLLTSAQLTELSGAQSPSGKVYVLENQMLFSSLCMHKGLRHPLLCTSRQLKEASWVLLDMLAEAGNSIWYAGDFDPEGLGIAERLWREYPGHVHFWHMSVEDYQRAKSQKAIESDARLQQLNAIQCPALQATARAIQKEKLAGYQEHLQEYYLQDLVSSD